ncbi:MAG: 3-dehydroquinate synthase [Bacteroidota bacterium]
MKHDIQDLAAFEKYLKVHAKDISGIFLLVDEYSEKNCLPAVLKNVPSVGDGYLLRVRSGEEYKTLDTCNDLWQSLSGSYADRSALLVNLGGGAICDMGGFTASTYQRGIRFVNIPTTLLAMVDAGIGGKVGVDLEHLKNQVGLFSLPEGVYFHHEFLNTLPKRDLYSGFAEMLKHGLIADESLWKVLKGMKPEDVLGNPELVARAAKIKTAITETDLTEKGARKKLNFGHTIGHALESWSLKHLRKSMMHGEAVAAGMICESYISCKTAGLPLKQLKEITKVLTSLYTWNELEAEMVLLIEIMKHDKKNKQGVINFTLLKQIGEAVHDCSADETLITESIEYFLDITGK